MRASADVDHHIASLATAQRGVVSRPQLVELGLGRGAIARRVKCGRLHRLHEGVYAVGHTWVPREGRWLAAVLACGPDAVLSHRAAAALWGIQRLSRGVTAAVTVDGNGGPVRRDGLIIYRSATLLPCDRTIRDGIPVTSVPRTLLALAAVVNVAVLDRAVEEAERLRLFDLRAVDEILGRHAGRPGAPALARAVAAWRDPAFTRSELERAFAKICRRYRLPAPSINTSVLGKEVDFFWPEQRLIVETDSRRWHGTVAAFERDRVRDAELTAAGYRVVRFTYRRVMDEPKAVGATLRRLLR